MTVARKPSGTTPSQVTVYVVFSQSVVVPAGTCAVPDGSAEAHPVSSRQARTATVRLRKTAGPEPLRNMDIGDHLARDAQDGGVSISTRESHRLYPPWAGGAARRAWRASRCSRALTDCGR
jgi:hypothetical protein